MLAYPTASTLFTSISISHMLTLHSRSIPILHPRLLLIIIKRVLHTIYFFPRKTAISRGCLTIITKHSISTMLTSQSHRAGMALKRIQPMLAPIPVLAVFAFKFSQLVHTQQFLAVPIHHHIFLLVVIKFPHLAMGFLPRKVKIFRKGG